MTVSDQPIAPASVERRDRNRSDLIWHAGMFVTIGACLWLFDVWHDGSISWARWITVVWGFGLALHALVYWIGGRGLQERPTSVDHVVDDEAAAAAAMQMSAGPQRNL